MAAFPQSFRDSTPSSTSRSGISRSSAPLPRGACNYRALDGEVQGPTCGCRRFWWSEHPSILHEPIRVARNGPQGNAACVCGHHACFHDAVEHRFPATTRQLAASPQFPSSRLAGLLGQVGSSNTKTPLYLQLVQQGDDGALRPIEIQGKEHVDGGGTNAGRNSDEGRAVSDNETSRGHGPLAGSERPPSAPPGRMENQSDSVQIVGQRQLYEMPPIPSQCLLTSADWQPYCPNVSHPPTQQNVSKTAKTGSGLGLVFQQEAQLVQSGRRNSMTSTIADDPLPHNPYQASLPSTRPPSSTSSLPPRRSPAPAFVRRIASPARAMPVLEVPYNFPVYSVPEDVIQSATEIATPSIANTPEVRAAEHFSQQAKQLADTVNQALTAFGPTTPSRDDDPGRTVQPGASNSASPRLMPVPISNRTIGNESTTPQSLQPILLKLLPFLSSLQGHLSNSATVSASVKTLSDKLELLENASFQHIPADELLYRFDLIDGRLTELETWKEEHAGLHSALEGDQVARSNSSFGSHQPAAFTAVASSSSQQAIAMDKDAVNAKLDGLDSRLANLESAALPTYARPWEVEVVYLPWGDDLKGIWCPLDIFARSSSRHTTQDTEEWTQAQSLNSSFSGRLSESGYTGWSKEAIHDWAGSAQQWLYAKACSTKSTVYRRLQSRGFIRRVTLHKPSAGDIQRAIAAAFREILQMSSGHDDVHEDSANSVGSKLDAFLGLRATYIPLRKVHKSSRLRFLTPAEMATSATWDAQFLASSVMMLATGGEKRLFVTGEAAYLQRNKHTSQPWTWRRIRELPRIPTPDEVASDHAEEVAEGDAKESCWTYNANLDMPPSVHSSFSASFRSQLEESAAEPVTAPATELNEKAGPSYHVMSESGSGVRHPQPITPLSEFPPQAVTNSRRARTKSLPLTDEGGPSTQAKPKRRITSFELSLAEAIITSSPTVSPERSKRRRLTRSPQAEAEAQMRAWGFTPRRSREPPSPFFSERQVPSEGRSQVTAPLGIGVNAPYAYATPHSGNIVPQCFVESGDTEVDSEPAVMEDRMELTDNDSRHIARGSEQESWGGVDEESDQRQQNEADEEESEYVEDEDEDFDDEEDSDMQDYLYED